jgi:hypothetical protein
MLVADCSEHGNEPWLKKKAFSVSSYGLLSFCVTSFVTCRSHLDLDLPVGLGHAIAQAISCWLLTVVVQV